MTSRAFRITALVAAALVLAALMLGLARKTLLTPLEREGRYAMSEGYASDGWIGERARFRWPGLSSQGNRVRVQLDPWRPQGAGPAALTVYNCGTKIGEISVSSRLAPTLPLSADCPDVEVELQVSNSFESAEQEPRTLGVKVEAVEITSALGIPIVELRSIALAALCLLLVWGCMLHGLGRAGSWSAFSFSAFLLMLAWQQRYFDPLNVLTLSLLIAGVCVGMRLGMSGQAVLREPARWASLAACVAVVVGTLLRFYGLDFGLPAVFHPDELQKVGPIERMAASGTLNPGYFLHPSLLLYLSYGVWHLGTTTLFPDLAPYHQIILAGRTVSALAGSVSVLLVFLIARRVLAGAQAAFAALLFALLPLAVTTSRYMKEDALLTALVLGVVLLTLLSVERKSGWMLALAGVLAGCASAAKYTGVLSVCVVLAAPWLQANGTGNWVSRAWIKWALIAVVLIPVGFIMCTPYAILDLTTFLKDFGFESRHMTRGHTSGIDPWSQLWMFHWRRSVVPGVSLVVAGMALLGAGMAIRLRDRHLLFMLGLVLLFYLPAEFVKAKPAPQFERYVVPILPFLSILAALGVGMLSVSRLRGLMVAALVIAFPAQRVYALARDISPDTRDQAARWAEQHLAPGSSVLLFWEPYSPPIDRRRFRVTVAPRPDLLEELSLRRLRMQGSQFLILSSLYWDRYFSQPGTSGAQREVFRQLFRSLPERARFTAPSGSYGFHNPEIRILEITPAEAPPAPVQ